MTRVSLRALIAPLVALLMLMPLEEVSAADESPLRVVVSVKPLHGLVAAVMEGTGAAPLLLVTGAGSPHGTSLRPSQARALREADLVFWIGPQMEGFLQRPLQALAGGARVVTVMADADLSLLPRRAGGAWDDHGAEAGHDHEADEAEAALDPHVWLDPANARRIVAAVGAALSDADPAEAETYGANAARMEARLTQLDAALEARLAPLRKVPFVVFHDAYQYLEHRYGLSPLGAITVSPERLPGARRLSEIRARVAALGARCVFGEPQFEPGMAKALLGGTARFAELDPLGAAIPAGPDAYPQIMESLADALAACLTEPD
jgi:zinc transport system substrate-binding protein